MSAKDPSRRVVAFLILIVFVVGALVVLGWLLKAAFFALGVMMKLVTGLGGLLLLVLLIWLCAKGLSKKD